MKQIIGTNTIYSDKRLTEVEKNHHTGKIINFITYLLEWHNCKIPYVDKSETPFNIRLINQRKKKKNPNSILAYKTFNKHDHDSKNHRKFTIKEQLRNITTASTKAFFKRKTKAARKLLNNETWEFYVTGSEPRTKLKPKYANISLTNRNYFSIVIRNGKIVWKHGPYC